MWGGKGACRGNWEGRSGAGSLPVNKRLVVTRLGGCHQDLRKTRPPATAPLRQDKSELASHLSRSESRPTRQGVIEKKGPKKEKNSEKPTLIGQQRGAGGLGGAIPMPAVPGFPEAREWEWGGGEIQRSQLGKNGK